MTEPNGRSGSPKQIKAVDFDGGSLNDDVLTEILERLPVKSVIRFQSVSKSWLSLISAHQFRFRHTLRHRHKSRHSLLLAMPEQDGRSLFYSNPIILGAKMRIIPFGIVNNYKIVSCSNGLMLLQYTDDDNFKVKDLYVHNPATKQSRKLSLPHNRDFIHIHSLHLLYDPSKSLHYEIVCVRYRTCRHHQVEVFESGTGRWRVCGDPITNRLICKLGSCVHYKRLMCLTYGYDGCILFYDIVKDTWHNVQCPDTRHHSYESLQESNGVLYYCALFPNGFDKEAGVWELEVDEDNPSESKWLLKKRVSSLGDGKEPKLSAFIAETSTMLIHVHGKVVAYNFLDQTYWDLLHLGSPTKRFWISPVDVYPFGETLALL